MRCGYESLGSVLGEHFALAEFCCDNFRGLLDPLRVIKPMDFMQRGYQSLDTAFANISLEQTSSCCVQNNKHCDLKISTFRT